MPFSAYGNHRASVVHSTETYVHAVLVGNTVYIFGQTALDPQGNLVGRGDVEAPATQVYENLRGFVVVDRLANSDFLL